MPWYFIYQGLYVLNHLCLNNTKFCSKFITILISMGKWKAVNCTSVAFHFHNESRHGQSCSFWSKALIIHMIMNIYIYISATNTFSVWSFPWKFLVLHFNWNMMLFSVKLHWSETIEDTLDQALHYWKVKKKNSILYNILRILCWNEEFNFYSMKTYCRTRQFINKICIRAVMYYGIKHAWYVRCQIMQCAKTMQCSKTCRYI